MFKSIHSSPNCIMHRQKPWMRARKRMRSRTTSCLRIFLQRPMGRPVMMKWWPGINSFASSLRRKVKEKTSRPKTKPRKQRRTRLRAKPQQNQRLAANERSWRHRKQKRSPCKANVPGCQVPVARNPMRKMLQRRPQKAKAKQKRRPPQRPMHPQSKEQGPGQSKEQAPGQSREQSGAQSKGKGQRAAKERERHRVLGTPTWIHVVQRKAGRGLREICKVFWWNFGCEKF